MSMRNGENKYFTREVILWVISFSALLVFSVIVCIIVWKSDQNKRAFIKDISANIEEAELYFREKEGWEIEVNKEEESLLLTVTTEEGIQYIFIETYAGDDIDGIVQEMVREENGKASRGTLSIQQDTWNFTDVIDVTINPEGPGMVGVKYGIPEFELIDDWGDTAEAELGILRWVNKDKIRADWEYAEEMMQKLEEFVRLSPFNA